MIDTQYFKTDGDFMICDNQKASFCFQPTPNLLGSGRCVIWSGIFRFY